MTSLNLNSLLKALSPNIIMLGVGLPHMKLGVTSQAIVLGGIQATLGLPLKTLSELFSFDEPLFMVLRNFLWEDSIN